MQFQIFFHTFLSSVCVRDFFCIFKTMAEDFKWTGKKKKSGYDIYHYPSLGTTERYRSVAIYYDNSGVLSLEFFTKTDYEWLDLRKMRNVVGRELASIFNVDRFIFWAEQPTKAKPRGGKGISGYIYQQQFCCKPHSKPNEEILKSVYGIMNGSAIEGEECTDYKYRVSKAKDTPIERTSSKIQKRKRERDMQGIL